MKKNIVAHTQAIECNSYKTSVLTDKVEKMGESGPNNEANLEVVDKRNRELVEELNDLESRKNNLVTHGLDEATLSENAIIKDLNTLCEVVSVMDIDINLKRMIHFNTHLGIKKNWDPRPLLIGFKETWVKDLFIQNAYQLKKTRPLIT